MLTILFIFLCLGTNTHAGFIKSDINVTEELNTIEYTLLTRNDIKLITEVDFKPPVVMLQLVCLGQESATTIGLEELRRALKLSTSSPWKNYNKTEPCGHELESTKTIEEYYNLKEPRSQLRSLDSPSFYKENFDSTILLFDKRLPSIRAIFKKQFEKVPEVIDKTTVDNMIEVFKTTDLKVRFVCWKMMFRSMILQNSNNYFTNEPSVPDEQTPRPQLPSKIEKPEVDMF